MMDMCSEMRLTSSAAGATTGEKEDEDADMLGTPTPGKDKRPEEPDEDSSPNKRDKKSAEAFDKMSPKSKAAEIEKQAKGKAQQVRSSSKAVSSGSQS